MYIDAIYTYILGLSLGVSPRQSRGLCRTGAWRGSWPWRNPRNGSWPWRNPRNGSWPWENPRNDFLAILHSKDQHLLNYMNMNLYCKEEKHLERDHGFSTACLSMTSHYVPVTVD